MKASLSFVFVVLALSCVACVTLKSSVELSSDDPIELLQKTSSTASTVSPVVSHDDVAEEEEEDDKEDAREHDDSEEKARDVKEDEEREDDEKDASASSEEEKDEQEQAMKESFIEAQSAAVTAKASAEQAAIQRAAPAAPGAPNLPLWYVTTMLGQAALSGGMGGLGRKTSASKAHGPAQSTERLSPMAPEMYHTALLATHLAVSHRAFHAGTIPTGVDAFERQNAAQMKAFHDWQRMQQQQQMMYGQFPNPMAAAYGHPMMPPMQQPMPYGAYGQPQMPYGQPQMQPYGQMPFAQPQMFQQGNPYMTNPYAPQAQAMANPVQAKAHPSQAASKITLKANGKVTGLKSSLISEIEASRSKKDF